MEEDEVLVWKRGFGVFDEIWWWRRRGGEETGGGGGEGGIMRKS